MTVRALVAGLGAIGQRHARNLRALLGDELELAALRSRRCGRVVTDSLRVVEGHPEDDCNGGVFTDVDDALAWRPDIVFVCTPSRAHVPLALAAVRAGSAVFVEKPLSDELAGVAELIAETKARNALVAVGCQLRFHPALRWVRAILAGESLGRLITVQVEQGEHLPGWHPYEDYRTSYAARRELGGGVVLTQIHELDYLHWLFGVPRRVFAVGGQLGSIDVDVEDTASMLFEHRYLGRALPVHTHLDYLQRPPKRTLRIVGELGTVDVDLRAPSLTWRDTAGAVVEHDDFPGFTRAQLFVDEMKSFLHSWRTGAAPEVGVEWAAETLRIALAARQSVELHTLECVS